VVLRRGLADALYPGAELPGLLRRPFLDAAENLCAERWWGAVPGEVHQDGQIADETRARWRPSVADVERSAGRAPRPGDESLRLPGRLLVLKVRGARGAPTEPDRQDGARSAA
jgi:hypothetical protein